MLSEHRVYSERMVSKQNLVSAFERGGNAENKQRKHDNKVNSKCTVIDMWMLCDGKKINFFGVPRSYPHIVFTCTMCIVSAWWIHDKWERRMFQRLYYISTCTIAQVGDSYSLCICKMNHLRSHCMIFLRFFFFQLNILQQACV